VVAKGVVGESVGKDVNLVSKSVVGVSVFFCFDFEECIRGERGEWARGGVEERGSERGWEVEGRGV